MPPPPPPGPGGPGPRFGGGATRATAPRFGVPGGLRSVAPTTGGGGGPAGGGFSAAAIRDLTAALNAIQSVARSTAATITALSTSLTGANSTFAAFNAGIRATASELRTALSGMAGGAISRVGGALGGAGAGIANAWQGFRGWAGGLPGWGGGAIGGMGGGALTSLGWGWQGFQAGQGRGGGVHAPANWNLVPYMAGLIPGGMVGAGRSLGAAAGGMFGPAAGAMAGWVGGRIGAAGAAAMGFGGQIGSAATQLGGAIGGAYNAVATNLGGWNAQQQLIRRFHNPSAEDRILGDRLSGPGTRNWLMSASGPGLSREEANDAMASARAAAAQTPIPRGMSTAAMRNTREGAGRSILQQMYQNPGAGGFTSQEDLRYAQPSRVLTMGGAALGAAGGVVRAGGYALAGYGISQLWQGYQNATDWSWQANQQARRLNLGDPQAGRRDAFGLAERSRALGVPGGLTVPEVLTLGDALGASAGGDRTRREQLTIGAGRFLNTSGIGVERGAGYFSLLQQGGALGAPGGAQSTPEQIGKAIGDSLAGTRAFGRMEEAMAGIAQMAASVGGTTLTAQNAGELGGLLNQQYQAAGTDAAALAAAPTTMNRIDQLLRQPPGAIKNIQWTEYQKQHPGASYTEFSNWTQMTATPGELRGLTRGKLGAFGSNRNDQIFNLARMYGGNAPEALLREWLEADELNPIQADVDRVAAGQGPQPAPAVASADERTRATDAANAAKLATGGADLRIGADPWKERWGGVVDAFNQLPMEGKVGVAAGAVLGGNRLLGAIGSGIGGLLKGALGNVPGASTVAGGLSKALPGLGKLAPVLGVAAKVAGPLAAIWSSVEAVGAMREVRERTGDQTTWGRPENRREIWAAGAGKIPFIGGALANLIRGGGGQQPLVAGWRSDEDPVVPGDGDRGGGWAPPPPGGGAGGATGGGAAGPAGDVTISTDRLEARDMRVQRLIIEGVDDRRAGSGGALALGVTSVTGAPPPTPRPPTLPPGVSSDPNAGPNTITPGAALTGQGQGLSGIPYEAEIKEAAGAAGIDPALLAAVVKGESGFDPKARSGAGAMGLTQLMPGTAAGLGVKDPWDPKQNLAGGAEYLKQLLKQFGGDVPKALAAYNAGPGRVQQFGGDLSKWPAWLNETKKYVPKVMGFLNDFKSKAGAAAGGAAGGAAAGVGNATAQFVSGVAAPENRDRATKEVMRDIGSMMNACEAIVERLTGDKRRFNNPLDAKARDPSFVGTGDESKVPEGAVMIFGPGGGSSVGHTAIKIGPNAMIGGIDAAGGIIASGETKNGFTAPSITGWQKYASQSLLGYRLPSGFQAQGGAAGGGAPAAAAAATQKVSFDPATVTVVDQQGKQLGSTELNVRADQNAFAGAVS